MNELQERLALVESLAEQFKAAVESASEVAGRGEWDCLARAQAREALMLAADAAGNAAHDLLGMAVAA